MEEDLHTRILMGLNNTLLITENVSQAASPYEVALIITPCESYSLRFNEI